MRLLRVVWLAAAGAIGVFVMTSGSIQAAHHEEASPDWSFNATLIEACSCPTFCPCFFNTQPAAHGGGEHFCRFNVAYRVNKGKYGDVDLKGTKFWLAGDLGHSFAEMEGEWAVLTFDPAVSEAQQGGIKQILSHMIPLKWRSFETAEDAPIEWEKSDDGARASLDGGKVAEVVLKPSEGMNGEPVVLQNVKYMVVPRNDGLTIMPNEIEAYRAGDKPFAFKGTTGFTTTLDMTSKDLK